MYTVLCVYYKYRYVSVIRSIVISNDSDQINIIMRSRRTVLSTHTYTPHTHTHRS